MSLAVKSASTPIRSHSLTSRTHGAASRAAAGWLLSRDSPAYQLSVNRKTQAAFLHVQGSINRIAGLDHDDLAILARLLKVKPQDLTPRKAGLVIILKLANDAKIVEGFNDRLRFM